MSKHERTVAFGVVDEGRVGEHIQRQQANEKISLGRVIDAIPQFIQVTHHPTFRAEYVVQNNEDIVIHFFLPVEVAFGAYWTSAFPVTLDRFAQAYFSATRPRLQAKYTEELKSWWFKAHGYGHIVDLSSFIHGFFDGLDAALKDRGRAESGTAGSPS
jgi:hypothetical protein